jgi:hypothetical protein
LVKKKHKTAAKEPRFVNKPVKNAEKQKKIAKT